jgi:hypothetical protein
LQADGTGSGSQNQTFLDGSTNNFFITRNGNTTQGSFSPFSQAPGYWGNYFGAYTSGFGIYCNPGASVAFGTGDFTVECWAYMDAIPSGSGSNAYILDTRNGSGNWAFSWNWTGSSQPNILFWTRADNTYFNATVGMPYFSWNHVAYVRSGGVGTIYLNGVAVGTAADTSTYSSISKLDIGARYQYNVGMPGYLSNLRILNGTALYTSNFTPSTAPLTAITNTSLLTCQSNRFVDNSANNFAMSIGNGTPSVQAFGPFAPALQWTPDVVGGSGYFDGSGDSLTTSANANLAIGTSDFCIEWFYYQTSTQTSATPFCQWGGGANDWILQYNSSNFIFYYAGGGNSISYSYTPVPNQWTHGCVCRSGSTMSLYLNGVRVNTKTDSTSIPNTRGLVVGLNPDGTQDCTGYIAYPRLVVGSSVYTPSSTTLTVPTAPLTAVSGTKFLASMTNAGIYDGKMGNVVETVGNAQVATNPVKYGSGSMAFDGTGDYLIMPNSPIYDFGAGDFTIEGWVYVTSTSASRQTFIGRGVNGGASFHIALETTGNWIYYLSSNNSTWNIASAVNIGVNRIGVWQHIALVRAGTVFTPYLNGIAGTTTTSSSAIYWSSASAAVNCVTVGATEAGTQTLFGFIDDLRITKGVCRYFTTFTPPQQALPRQ